MQAAKYNLRGLFFWNAALVEEEALVVHLNHP